MPRSSSEVRPGVRRTQAERRATTRAALTDAALDTLATVGFSATKVADVAERAGVSVGAALHYFPQKTDLAIGALEDGLDASVMRLRERVEQSRGRPDRDALILDAVYEIFEGRVYQAFLGVQVHARNDAAMYPRLSALVQRSVDELILAVVDGCGPELSRSPKLPVLVGLIIATVRGIAIVGPADPLAPHDTHVWEMARAWFVAEIDTLRRQVEQGCG